MSNIGNKEILARNLVRFINRSGKSQKELAEIFGVAPSTFNDWTKGKKYPRIDKIEIMANFFGILKSDLIEDKDEAHIEIQQKNDTLSDVIIRMRTDSDFLLLVESLAKLDREQILSVKQMLTALLK